MALLAANVHAQQAVAERAASAPHLATKDDYAACLDAQDRLEWQRAALNDAERMLQAQAAKVQAADADLAAQVKKHRPSNQAEVASYNRAVETRNRSVDALNREVRALQAAQDAFNSRVFDSNARCLGLMVPAEVAASVKAERVHRQSPKRTGTAAADEPASAPPAPAAAR
ncbi:MAG: hypothetical protein ACOZJX_15940 [Pseudomonadota bacterium]